MDIDDPLEQKLQSIIASWEQEDPGSTDVDSTQLPEMDLSGGKAPDIESAETVADNEAAEGEPESLHTDSQTALRLRKPSSGVNSTPGAPLTPPAKVDPSKLDWKGLQNALQNAQMRGQSTRDADNFLMNASGGRYRPDASYTGGADVATAPLTMAKEQQGLESRQAGIDKNRRAGQVADALDNPNSLQSQKARQAWRAFGLKEPPGFDNWSANDVGKFSRGATDQRKLESDAAGAAAKTKTAAERQAFEDARRAAERTENNTYRDQSHKDSMANAAATRALAAAANNRAETPKLPPGQVAEVADFKTAAAAADELLDAYESADLGGLLSKGAGRISDATGADLGAVSQYNDKANTAAQTIGLALEGGKLGEADLPRYRAMLPQAGDSIERAKAKRDNLKRALADKAAGRSVEWLKAGYKVPESPGGSPSPGGGTIRVRNRKTKATGSMPAANFDPEKYERL